MLNVTISNPEGIILDTKTDCVVAKTINGEISFYKDHLPFISTIIDGYIKINNEKYDIKNGTILLDEDNNVIILDN